MSSAKQNKTDYDPKEAQGGCSGGLTHEMLNKGSDKRKVKPKVFGMYKAHSLSLKSI